MITEPTYDREKVPAIVWEEPKRAGADGYFEDFPDVRIIYALGNRTRRSSADIADKVHTPELKDAIKDAVSNFLPWSTGVSNYGDGASSRSCGIHFDVDPEDHDITEALLTLHDVISETEGAKVVVGDGVKFDGTNSDGYSEREFMVSIIHCQQRHGSEIPAIGKNVRGEVQLSQVGIKKSRPDAVEYDEFGNAISVIECQSGIKDGANLDNDHFARIISEYPEHPDFKGTVRKLVVIAGAYAPHYVATLRALQGSRFERVIILQTAIDENNVVVLRDYQDPA